MRLKILGCVVAVAVLGVTGCQGSVLDPQGEDYAGPADVREMRFRFGIETTTFVLRLYGPPHESTQFLGKHWLVSTDRDVIEDVVVHINEGYPSDFYADRWSVKRGDGVVCSGPIPNGGWDGYLTIALTIPSSCLADGGVLPDGIRVSGATLADRSGADGTQYSGYVPPS